MAAANKQDSAPDAGSDDTTQASSINKKDRDIAERHKELCNALNLDKCTADESWVVFSTVMDRIIIEGDKLHWLACAIYTCASNKSSNSTSHLQTQKQSTISTGSPLASSKRDRSANNKDLSKDTSQASTTPNLATKRQLQREKEREKTDSQRQNDALSESSGIPLNNLLRLCQLSLVDFFAKMKKWLDITNQGQDIRLKIERLERNFNVSAVVFKKYKEIFFKVFKKPVTKIKDEKTSSAKKSPERERTRKSTANSRMNVDVTCMDVYKFCWILYVNFKDSRSSIKDDLVNSYYRMIACIDFCYANALVSKFSHDLLNPSFKGLPKDFNSSNLKLLDASKQPLCILQTLCKTWDGRVLDAKEIREHWLQPFIEGLVSKKVLTFAHENPHLGCFESNNFESNLTKLSKEQDILMLSSGDFDERIFLSDNAEQELGTPIYMVSDLTKMINERDSSTALTANDNDLDKQRPSLRNGGRFVPQTPLSNRNYLANKTIHPSSPVANATLKVCDLHQMLSDCSGQPTASLEDIFKLCSSSPKNTIMDRVTRMTEKFVSAFVEDKADEESTNLATTRVDFARKLYFKVLESIIIREQKRLPTDKIGESLSGLLLHEIFHISLFACCVEIVLASHNATSKTFPWILEVYKDFGETRLYPFHFYKVIELVIREEDRLSRDIVKHLAFIEERVLESFAWESDSPLWTTIAAHGSIPSCQDVILPPSMNEHNLFEVSPLSSLRRNEGLQSPMPVSGRYSINTMELGARRRLFDQSSESSTANQQIIHVAVPQRSENGEVRYIIEAWPVSNSNDNDGNSNRNEVDQSATAPIRPAVKANPVTLFFRKVYQLAQLRFRDLWNRLQINTPDLQRRIWTLFETQIRNHTNLLRDRHLDQMIMCATYAIIKVCRTDRSPKFFQEIMKVYRYQPQANIDVYRNVLLSKPPLKLLDDGPSRTSQNSITTRSPSKRIANSPMRNGITRAQNSSTVTESPQQKERGDLIEFYNNVYVSEVRSLLIRFARPDSALNLSPLPRMNSNPVSPWRRVSQQHSVYVSPLKSSSLPPSPARQLSYSFQRSPSKDLRMINTMINKQRAACKRILQDDDGENTKKPCISEVASRKINDIMNERRGSN